MRNLIILVFILLHQPGIAADQKLELLEEKQLFSGSENTKTTLRMLSSTDTDVFAPTIDIFLKDNPSLSIEYLVASSTDIDTLFRQSPGNYDVVISSAMDLQLKLVNDGFAYSIPNIQHPDWAQWRRSLFGFTLEPAGIIFNKEYFENIEIPQSRQQMIRVLREHPELFHGKLATYDVRLSGLGYLFATQDARDSETYWRLMEVFGNLDTRLYCCSGEMIDDLASGKVVIAYNVLTSYAKARLDVFDSIDWILPNDYTNVMMRTAMVSADSKKIKAATAFMRYLTTQAMQTTASDKTPLPPLQSESSDFQNSVIPLDPGLMIFLDQLKRRTFINAWENAVIQ